MKKIITVVLLTAGYSAFSQTTDAEKQLRSQNADTTLGWKKGAAINVGLSQASLTNWAAGGQNSFSANGLVSLFANYKASNYTWSNSLDLGYGFLQQGKSGKFIKTDDKIDFTSIYGRKASKNWYYSGLLNFKTQMTDGFNYPNDSVVISKFLAPGYLIGAIGMEYKPNDNFSVFIAPLTSKSTFVSDQKLADAGSFGVDKATYDGAGVLLTKGKQFRSEFGGYLRMLYKKNLMENVLFQTKLDLFTNYGSSDIVGG